MQKRFEHVLFFDEKGNIFYFKENSLRHSYSYYPTITSQVSYHVEDLMRKAGYRTTNICDVLNSMLGYTEEQVLSEIERRGKNASEKRKKKKEMDQQWGKCSKELKLHIIGFKSEHFRIFEDGFAVTILLKKTGDRIEHREWTRSHMKEFMSYVYREIEVHSRIMNTIGDIQFYKPHKLIFRNIDEIEVQFVLKDGIEHTLKK